MILSPRQLDPRGAADCFAGGGGEMGERIRAFDWSRTPVGPAEDWPQSLKTAVRIVQSSRYPMFLWWGRELTNFYNDAYVPVLGKRHPEALGRPAPEVWADIWGTVGPQAEIVLGEGRATWNEELLLVMERYGFAEETYFTFSYSPVPDDDGRVGGVFCACMDDTGRVLGERRLRTLRDLGERSLAEARTAEQACRAAAATLAENPHDFPVALIYLLDGDGRQARLAEAVNLDAGADASPASVVIGGEGDAWGFRHVLDAGRSRLVEDLAARFGPLPAGPWTNDSTKRALVLPLARAGASELAAGFLVAGLSPRLTFDDAYRGFLELAARQIANSMANARAHEEERRRAEALAELDRAKTAFFSNVSHEFRTPLTLMLGPLEDVLTDADGAPPASRERLVVAYRSALRLQKLVNTLLDFSRIEAGRIQAAYEPTDLAALTVDLASVFRSAVERAGLRLVVDCPPLDEPVWVDREMWEKIVSNLLSNALKFTFEGKIEVRLRRDGDHAVLTVRDTGTGIPADEAPHLFERFHRVKGTRGRTFEGTGIGLALVQELVKLHGGVVRVESEVDRGSTFTVAVPLGTDHLPADRIGSARTLVSTGLSGEAYVEEALRWLPEGGSELRAPVSERATGTAPGSHPARILLADDNADLRAYLRRLLGRTYDVIAVGDGAAALRAAREQPFDLVLADVMMPQLDGFGLLAALRADERTKALPVFLLSARAGEEARIEGLAAGADDYLVKPFSARELLARVGARLALRESADRLRESEERLQAALDGGRLGAWSWDPSTERIAADPRALKLFGLDPSGFTGDAAALFERVHPEDRPGVVEALRQTDPGSDYYAEFRVLLPGGRVRWLAGAGRARLDSQGRVLQVNGVNFDITRRKRSELELREVDRRKDEFLAMLAHELRNPLAPIRNAAQVLKLVGPADAHQRWAREVIERQTQHLTRLVDDLLDVSRITLGKVTLASEPLDLATIVNRAVEASRPLIEARRHRLAVVLPPEPVRLEGDPTRLVQVVGNLLNNAAKYTDEGGDIRLEAAQDGGEAVVSVRDNGVGLSAELLPHVFDLFTQADRSLDRSQGGLGIGLTLVRQLVELHGGRVEARSEGPGRGSEFIVRLPSAARAAATDTDAAGERALPAVRGLKVLVVEDNVDAAEVMSFMLQLGGHDVRTAHDGPQALVTAREFKPHAVVCDIGLPGMNGYEVAARLREEPDFERTPLIALTGYGQEEARRRSRAAGFDYHLVKPVEPDALAALLDGLRAEERAG